MTRYRGDFSLPTFELLIKSEFTTMTERLIILIIFQIDQTCLQEVFLDDQADDPMIVWNYRLLGAKKGKETIQQNQFPVYIVYNISIDTITVFCCCFFLFCFVLSRLVKLNRNLSQLNFIAISRFSPQKWE